jgi:conjugal transfer pilus assembly protein TraL
MTPLPLPRTVDDPPTFLLWRADDMAAPILALAIGFFIEKPMTMMLAGAVLSLVYRRYREGRPEFYVFHALYWAGLWPGRGHAFANPFARVFLP